MQVGYIIEDEAWHDLCKEIAHAWNEKGIEMSLRSFSWDERKSVAFEYLTNKIREMAASSSLPPCTEETFLEEGPECGLSYDSVRYTKNICGVPVKNGQRTLAWYFQLLARLDDECAYDLAREVRTKRTILEWDGYHGYLYTWIFPDGSLFSVEDWLGWSERDVKYYHYSVDGKEYLVNTVD